jgi:(2Fe-2S) ferredoxin
MPLSVHRIASPSAAALYGRRLVLVRPDGHVAWRSDVVPENATSLIDTVRGAGPRITARRARRSPQPRQAETASAGDPPASRRVAVE